MAVNPIKHIERETVVIYTVGHSTRTLDEFVALLRAHGIAAIIDVRTIPRSRHNPQFNGPDLARRLRARRIGYRHMKGLGGLRHAHKDSQNTAWRNASFRGFADYMQTDAFEQNLAKLINLAAMKRGTHIAIMCAEAVPWRCHRSLIADALGARGIPVNHITSATGAHPHKITPWAMVRRGKVTYPASAAQSSSKLRKPA